MPDLPRGTVTMLFTDIEGSTRLLQELGRRYVEALTAHRTLLREALTSHGGVEVEMQGDSFHFAFETARAAVSAAAEAQKALVAYEWREGPIRVRIGLHTGEPVVADHLYAGLDVHRAARVMGAAHGGQVLLSGRTADFVAGEPPDGVVLRDLGEHRLKDLLEAERLIEVVVEGLPSDFPPPKTLENRPTNLPVQPTSLVGRTRELAEAHDLLLREDVRLLTLTGPAGTGKTRLALQVGAELLVEFQDGVYLVTLAPVTDPELVVATIAQTLAVREQPGETIDETLSRHLGERELLLVLDNCEQVVEAAPRLARLLASAGRLNVLATSRAPLHVSGEHEFPVPPLATEEAVSLFAQGAEAARPSFALNGNRLLVVEICRRLDNLPLAIELAAARIKLLSEQALLERLDERLKLLTGGARDLPERQQTLRAAIDWSYGLLSLEEQTLFDRLAVFVGGATLEAVEAVCNREGELDTFEGIASLVDKSLLRRDEGRLGEPRFAMLETIREYACERLEDSGDADQVRRCHATHFLALAESADAGLRTAEHGSWMQRLGLEHDNLRAALEWASSPADSAVELSLAGALGEFWRRRAFIGEGSRYLERALEHRHEPSTARARALTAASTLAASRGDAGDAEAFATEGLVLQRQLGDEDGIARSLNALGIATTLRGDLLVGRRLFEESVVFAERSGDQWTQARALMNLGHISSQQAEHEQATELLEEALANFRGLGDGHGAAMCLENLGYAELAAGQRDQARARFRDLLETAHEAGLVERAAYAFEGLAASGGNGTCAARLLGFSAALRQQTGMALQPAEAAVHGRTVDRARAEIGEEAFAGAWAEGAELTLVEATTYALEQVKVEQPAPAVPGNPPS
jgi:predicted ATPase/class 3 adenylate cyclase